MEIRNSPLGYAIASGVLVCSLCCFPDRADSPRREETRQTSQQYVQPTTQPISETQSTTNSEYITPIK